MGHLTEVFLVLLITGLAAALPGVFLVLRRQSMVTDAIAHSVLLGIVLAFFLTHDLGSPLLLVGASLFGVLTVWCVESLGRSGLIREDTTAGVVYPLFFSLAVILISTFARNVHLDTDMVLMGDVVFAPLDRLEIAGISLPRSAVVMGAVFLVDLIFILIFFKELKLTTFDKAFAHVAGFSSGLLFYGLMTLVSFTSVAAFDAVGAILVISFFIAPAASACLVTRRLGRTLLVSLIYAAVNCSLGFFLAIQLNVSISGMCAVMGMLTFLLTVLFHHAGLITRLVERHRRRLKMEQDLFIYHVGNHQDQPDAKVELGVISIGAHLHWDEKKLARVAGRLRQKGLVEVAPENYYRTTSKGQACFDELLKDGLI